MTGDRTMSTPRFKRLTAMMLLALGLGACGGGSTDLAGIGGTGITATGQITGFGSIFVNGVEYEIKPGATIMVNGAPAQESDLRLGMIVTLSGTLNADGVTGTVDKVVYESEIEGPITAIDPGGPDPDNKIKTLVILGRTVIIDAISTSFGDDSDPSNNYSFSTIAVNDVVEVSGYITDSNGTLHATRIEKEAEHTPGDNTTVEVKGTVTDFGSQTNSFILDGVLTVNFDPATTDMQALTNGINIGEPVEVEGTFSDATTISATRIKPDDSGLPDDAEQAETEGLITDYISSSNFKVNGQQVDASGAQLQPAGATLQNGVFVEVEGPLVSGTLEATQVEVRNSNIEIEAYVSGTPANNTVRLQITGNDFITIAVDANLTQMEEDESGAPLTFAALNDGDFLKVEAYKNSDGDIVATQIKRLTSSEIELVLKAPLNSGDWTLNGGKLSVTLLGITFSSGSGTDFEHNDQSLADAAAMNDKLNSLGSGMVFKVGDEFSGNTYSDGVVSEMEVES